MKPATSSISSSDQRGHPIAAFLALGVIAIIELAYVEPRKSYFQEATYSLLEEKQKDIVGPSPPNDVAILGTSRMYHLRSKQLEQILPAGMKVGNYSWAWSGVEMYPGMLQALINADKTPRIILVEGTPEIFGYDEKLLSIRDDREYMARFMKGLPFRTAMTTELGIWDWKSIYHSMEYCLTPPTFQYRNGVKSAIQSWLNSGKKPGRPANYEAIVDQWEMQGGFQFAPADYTATEIDFRRFENVSGPYTCRDNPQVREIFESFLDLAESHKIVVIMVPVPNNPVMFEQFQSKGVYENYSRWLDSLEERYQEFKAVEPRWLNWPEHMADAGHLNGEGTKRHEKMVKDYLKAQTLGLQR